jgi:hypothetical protein
VAETRNRQRQVYFDLYFETMRCSARGYADPEIRAKLKGGPTAADERLATLGQRLHELLTRNDDVPPDVRDNIKDLLDQHPVMKKKFDELAAASAPAPKS